jgi:hypothetical protein
LDNSNTTYTATVTNSTSGAYQIGTLKIGDTETTLYGKDTNTTYTSLKNPYSLTIQGNSTTLTNGVYDGSAAKTVNITPASIGAAAAPVTYRTQDNETGFYKISINSTAAWMLAFRVRVYKQYQYFDIRFSGYNYQSNHWHAAYASLVDGDASTAVYMGYDDVNKMWVAIPAAQYTGIEIADCVNGFASTGKSLSELFTITRVDSLSGTTQHTYTLYPPSKSSHTHNYLPLGGGTLTGPLTITGTDSTTANLHFGRASYNYISGPSGSTIHMCPGGISKSSTTGYIFGASAFYPGTTNGYSIGTTSLQWNNICGKTLYENGTSLVDKYAAASHTHSYVPTKTVTFTPAETAIGPAEVLSKLGSGYALGKGTWDYAGNGYISKDTTGSIAIDLAGSSIIQFGSSSAYTQLYITAPASSTTNSKTNEMLFYNNHGSGYSPAWTRVLTDRNYSEYCATKTHTHDTLTPEEVDTVFTQFGITFQ